MFTTKQTRNNLTLVDCTCGWCFATKSTNEDFIEYVKLVHMSINHKKPVGKVARDINQLLHPTKLKA